MSDWSRRTLRELLILARERLGKAAVGLKTRDELIAALRAAEEPPSPPLAAPPAPPPQAPAAPSGGEVVTRDFFVARH